MEQINVMQTKMDNFIAVQTKQQQASIGKQCSSEQINNVKLPKIELVSFSGNKLEWTEFWDSYECSVHSNSKLSDIEKFTYLQSKLTGEARRAISGLALSHVNYRIAVDILHERFGNPPGSCRYSL